ncbi:unnamed protein product [Clonostachys rosea f. rosea IK726]|uniref:DUF1996 domain-containing protein n=2 Tax=Bionectria ochroleuca TaxID=29856 RepID=A0A0B7KI77_BIOOC|nr:unnamed protein product [Clonostachys rosea f. rosea IK726]
MLAKCLIAACVGLLGSAQAFWRMECPGRVGLARIDPIVNPGGVSKHVHAIHGSNGIGMTADSASLMAGDCTSCRVTQDMSAYWHPAVYFKDAITGQFEVVNQTGGMLAYYLLNAENITGYPANFRMLSGTTSRRTYTAGDPSLADPAQSLWKSLGQTTQEDLEQRALGFNCLNYDRPAEGTLYRHYMPDKAYLDANCKNGLRLEIMFPSCWDGVNTDSGNSKDHVAYPDLVMNGNCPETHPVRLPGLLYEVIWETQALVGRDGIFVLSNGDPSGFGYHADFIMGWEPGFLQEAIEICTNASGKIEDCPIFNVVDEATARECKMKTPSVLSSENVNGPLSSLPGNVEITYGDGSSDGDDDSKPSKTTPALTYAPGQTPSDAASPLPGQVFKESSVYVAPVPTTTSSSSSTSSTSSSSTTISTSEVVISSSTTSSSEVVISSSTTSSSAEVFVEQTSIPVPTTSAPNPVNPNANYVSTQYITNGNIVTKILYEEELIWVTERIEATGTVTITGTGPPTSLPEGSVQRKKRAAHMHAHAHGYRY